MSHQELVVEGYDSLMQPVVVRYRLYVSTAFPSMDLMTYQNNGCYQPVGKNYFSSLKKEHPNLNTWAERVQSAFNNGETDYPEIHCWSTSLLKDCTLYLDKDFNAIPIVQSRLQELEYK